MQETIRSFIAIELPDELKNEIELYVSELKKINPKVKWIKSNSLHITLKFLGNQPSSQIDKVVTTLLPIKTIAQPCQLTISQFGAFPNKNKPRVFWLGIDSEPPEPLHKLQSWIEDQMEILGLERESRRFSPHLTLGRVKFPDDFQSIWEYADDHPFHPFSFDINEIVLMRSFLKPEGAEYRTIHKYPLRQ